MENVKNLLSKKFKSHYSEWVQYLTAQGYATYTQVLDALNYGIPQHRERVFAVSILNASGYCRRCTIPHIPQDVYRTPKRKPTINTILTTSEIVKWIN